MINHYFTISLLESSSEHGYGDELIEVTDTSPLKIKKIVEKYAYYFKKEFGYDFVQYTASQHDIGDKKCIAYLFSSQGVYCGAICFQWRKWKDFPDCWASSWVWIHPYFRNHGLLTKFWKSFGKFVPFVCESPLSRAADEFLKRINAGNPDYHIVRSV